MKDCDQKQIDDFLVRMSVVKTGNGSIFLVSKGVGVDLNVNIDPERFVFKGR